MPPCPLTPISPSTSRPLPHGASPTAHWGGLKAAWTGRQAPARWSPHLAERWEQPDATTDLFRLRPGVQWHHKPPGNGRELVAEDMQVPSERFLNEKGTADRHVLEAVAHVAVVDR